MLSQRWHGELKASAYRARKLKPSATLFEWDRAELALGFVGTMLCHSPNGPPFGLSELSELSEPFEPFEPSLWIGKG